MSVVDFHVDNLHELDLRGQLLDFFFEFFVLLVQIGGLLWYQSNPVQGKRRCHAPRSGAVVPLVALTPKYSDYFGPKYQSYSYTRRKLGSDEAQQVFDIRTGSWEDEQAEI
jgi:hypothetical protein